MLAGAGRRGSREESGYTANGEFHLRCVFELRQSKEG